MISTIGFIINDFISSLASSLIGCFEGLYYGRSMGQLYRVKNNIFVKTDSGIFKIPSYKLPNLETDVYVFFGKENRFKNNKIYSSDIIDNLETYVLQNYRNCIIPNYDYSHRDMWFCVNNIFENRCYLYFVPKGQLIDYKLILNNYENKLEELDETDETEELDEIDETEE